MLPPTRLRCVEHRHSSRSSVRSPMSSRIRQVLSHVTRWSSENAVSTVLCTPRLWTMPSGNRVKRLSRPSVLAPARRTRKEPISANCTLHGRIPESQADSAVAFHCSLSVILSFPKSGTAKWSSRHHHLMKLHWSLVPKCWDTDST